MTGLSANTGFLWKDRPFLERIALAGHAGFDAVEFHDEWRHEPVEAVREALETAGLPVLGLNTRMADTAGCAAVPGEEAQARTDILAAIEAARALGAKAVHVMGGKVEADERVLATYRANLAFACEAGEGLTVLVEPLCRTAMPRYPIHTVADAARVVETVDAPNLRIMFDFFHVHQEGDDIPATFRRCREIVGHVQVADPQTRGEPRTSGPLAIGALVGELRAAGYTGALGCEYVPANGVENGLGWREALRPSA